MRRPQEPTISVNVRLPATWIPALDEWARYLASKRVSGVSRADIMRMALAKLPIPTDAPEALKAAAKEIQL